MANPLKSLQRGELVHQKVLLETREFPFQMDSLAALGLLKDAPKPARWLRKISRKNRPHKP